MIAFRACLLKLFICVAVVHARTLRSRQVASTGINTTANTSQLVVTTNVGTYSGIQVQPTVRQWLGIRYGASTNGSLRFRPPQRAAILPSSQVFDATSFSDNCPQNRGSAFTGFQLIQNLGNGTDGEDCLSLNIWAPTVDRLNSTSSGTAVMIWIYGGAFTFGSSNTPGYGGDYIVKDNEDVIVVTINYRTNAFGFPAGAPALSLGQTNIGLKDQRMAIEWVYNNIREFGGDPSRMTLFGESAGASSIGAYAYTYQYDPIVTGLIMESGSEYLMASETVTNMTNARAGWNYVAAQAGCPYNGSATGEIDSAAANQQLNCLQAVDFHRIQQAVSNYTGSVADFAPVADNITVYNAQGYSQLSAAGQFAKLPVLIGNNNNEGSILVALSPGVAPDVLTTVAFTCPAATVATAREVESVPSWQYRYFGMFPDLNPYPALGVYHSSEIGLVFGTYNLSTIAPSTSAEVSLSKAMQSGWVAFATDPVNGLNNYGWPQYQANGTSLIQLGGNNSAAVVFNSSQAYNGDCPTGSQV